MKQILYIYIDPYSRIDTNSIHTYGIQNSILYNVHIDSTKGNKRKMTDTEYRKLLVYKNYEHIQKKHDFDLSKFNIPVILFPIEESGKYVLESHVNIISPLIETKMENTYAIWITKWISRGHNLDSPLTVSVIIEDGEVIIKGHHYQKERDLQSMMFFTDPDYIRDLKRSY